MTKDSGLFFCEHGCDLTKNECIKKHEDEGKSCSNTESDDNYYAGRCDGSTHLECKSGSVVAKDCSTASCHDNFGCYEPCDTVGEYVYQCVEDTDGEMTYGYYSYEYICEEDPIYHIKHYTYDGYTPDWCDGTASCDQSTGR